VVTAPIDPQHGSSGGGGPVFPDPEIPQAPAESERPEVRTATGALSDLGQAETGHAAADLDSEIRHGGADIKHPGWCDTPNCHVRIDAGTPFGAHRSRAVLLPGRIEVRLSIWAIHGTTPRVAFDIRNDELGESLLDVEVPFGTAEVPITLGDLLRESGVLLDLEEARTAGRVLIELARQAEADS
jgi:hypothetical protein